VNASCASEAAGPTSPPALLRRAESPCACTSIAPQLARGQRAEAGARCLRRARQVGLHLMSGLMLHRTSGRARLPGDPTSCTVMARPAAQHAPVMQPCREYPLYLDTSCSRLFLVTFWWSCLLVALLVFTSLCLVRERICNGHESNVTGITNNGHEMNRHAAVLARPFTAPPRGRFVPAAGPSS
jgi:hypothetical protein